MDRGSRRITAEDKLRILEEGRGVGVNISEVCRRHQIAHAQFYRWERTARQGALEALRQGVGRAKKGGREERLMAELNRLRSVVAEIIAENLTLKKGLLV